MSSFKSLTVLIIALVTSISVYSQARLYADDLKPAVGQWRGTLSYSDYTTAKQTSILAVLEIKQLPKNGFVFTNSYPNEPKANSVDTVYINYSGRMLDNERITTVDRFSDGIKIVTEVKGTDGNNNQKALIRRTYQIYQDRMYIRKEVKFSGSSEWLQRNEYLFTRM